MTSPIFTNQEVNLLHSLRSRSVDCKVNFRGMYGSDLACSLCQDGTQDDQQHILACPRLRQEMKSSEAAINSINYYDLFANTSKQKEVTSLFEKLLNIRHKLLNKEAEDEQ